MVTTQECVHLILRNAAVWNGWHICITAYFYTACLFIRAAWKSLTFCLLWDRTASGKEGLILVLRGEGLQQQWQETPHTCGSAKPPGFGLSCQIFSRQTGVTECHLRIHTEETLHASIPFFPFLSKNDLSTSACTNWNSLPEREQSLINLFCNYVAPLVSQSTVHIVAPVGWRAFSCAL